MHKEHKEFLKRNALEMAKRHKETCEDPDCTLSLHLIGELIKLAGMELTPDEAKHLY